MPPTLTIAIDFDGTIVENKYPDIGKPLLFAFETLKKLQDDGHNLILWTYRKGSRLDEAVSFCKKNGIVFYAINKSYPEENYDESLSRKILADIFIDDRNIGGMLGWGEIYQMLSSDESSKAKQTSKKKKSRFFGRL
ncbi:BT0820 family HAD-type phosphatase [Zunongwangia sp. HGR-M22]|uniref:BT0820 family HAD-type phosphatase n=1 Tax=Zunongwangia sp. HGR-M22 TaxID=3015168 RepID=UPI0022DD6141|nr:hydrolase [Zunongwangia sp. HGR-M22]WBL26538.1 hydrolase [Zunongwangia sp. HGR-M22]